MSGAKAKILLLEDDPWFADSLIAVLSGDFDVQVCANPEKTFDVLDDWQPDLLLADIVLSPKNLFVLLNEIQSHIDTRQLKVVILTSSATRINSRDVAKFNVKKVLDKTAITPNHLRKVLTEICSLGDR